MENNADVFEIKNISDEQIKNSGYSKDFISEFIDHVNWSDIYNNVTLTESFVRKFKDKKSWNFISKQKISEDFNREFKDKVDWDYICNVTK